MKWFYKHCAPTGLKTAFALACVAQTARLAMVVERRWQYEWGEAFYDNRNII